MKKTILLLSSILLISCGSVKNVNDDFSVKSSNTNSNIEYSSSENVPLPVASPEPSSKLNAPLSVPPFVGNITQTKAPQSADFVKPRFDMIPVEDPKDAIPGSVTVIYKNSDNMRVKKHFNNFESEKKQKSDEINLILSENKV